MIECNFQFQIEKNKQEIKIKSDQLAGIISRKLVAYPEIVESIYRCRNYSKDLAAFRPPILEHSQIQKFHTILDSLKTYLYRYRLDLERENIFSLIHEYKRLIEEFLFFCEEKIPIVHHLSDESYPYLSDEEEIKITSNLDNQWTRIDSLHKNIILKLCECIGNSDTNPTTSNMVQKT